MPNLSSSKAPFLAGDNFERLAWWPPLLLDQIAQPVQAAWSAWMRDWISAPGAVGDGCACSLAHQAAAHADAQWNAIGTRGRAAAWIKAAHDPIEKIQQAIFGPGHHLTEPAGSGQRIAIAVATSAWAALAEMLRDGLLLDPAEGQSGPAPGVFKPWSGCVLVAPPDSAPLDCALLLNAECVRALLQSREIATAAVHPRQRTAVTPLEEALAEHKLLLRAELAGCELDMGELEHLSLGDIIPLAHGLDEPLLVSSSAQRPFCAAFLGKQAGSKAIELVPKAPVRGARPLDHSLEESQ
jgi:hypothetical protein